MGEMRKVVASLAGFFVSAWTAQASVPAPPHDYTVASKDGKFLLVMLVGPDWGKSGQHNLELRKKYQRSGLYKAGQPGRLLWPLAYVWGGQGELHVASDGIHVMQVTNPGHGREDGIALRFFSKGRLLKQYALREIILDKRVRDASLCPTGYCWWSSADVDDTTGRGIVTSRMGTHVFDVKTGVPLAVP